MLVKALQSYKIHYEVTGKNMTKPSRNSEQVDKQVTISDETILKIAKEITVKFIEVGKITPATFELAFNNIHSTIDQAVRKK